MDFDGRSIYRRIVFAVGYVVCDWTLKNKVLSCRQHLHASFSNTNIER